MQDAILIVCVRANWCYDYCRYPCHCCLGVHVENAKTARLFIAMLLPDTVSCILLFTTFLRIAYLFVHCRNVAMGPSRRGVAAPCQL
jgi:hypothetical protein